MSNGVTLWLTGLSGSGKTTIATSVGCWLDSRCYPFYHLDGDVLRNGLNSDLGFSRKDREENIRRAGEVAAMLSNAGLITICSFISPYKSDRERCRRAHNRLKTGYLEVFVNAPLSVCEQRDPKGLYKKARAGAIKNFTGVDDPYEIPSQALLELDTNKHSELECRDMCLSILSSEGYIVWTP